MAIQKNFNIVGSPVITDEGIASGFANGSYLTSTIDFETAVTIHTKIKTPTNWPSRYSCVHEFTTELGNMSVENSNRNFICYSYSQNKDVVVFKPSLNTIYYIKYTIDLSANEKRVSYSLNNVDWSSDVVIADTSMDKGTNPIFLIGINQGFNSPWLGTIDLKETYAEVNGSIIWNAWKDVGIIPGSITVNKGYYNADGTNIIKFTSPVTKTLTEAQENLSYENKILLTLDNQNSSSFVLTGTDTADPTEYVVTKELTTSPKVYVDPSKQYILGTEPTGINASVDSYSAEANGSVSLTRGWIYSDGITYQNKDTNPLSVSTLTGNATGIIGYKNKLQLGYESSSDVSIPCIQEGLTLYAYDMNTDIYLDNTKSKILGTTALSDSWKDSPYTIQKGIPVDYKQYKIVGNGTTIENGIASGFSESSYIQFIESPFTSTDPDSFKMFFEVTTGDATHSYQEVIAQNNCILLRKSDTTSWNIAVYNGSSWDTTHFGTYAYNTKYYIRVIYFKNTTIWNGYSYTGGYTYAEVSTDNSSWTRTYRTNKPNFASTEPIYLGTNGSNEWWSGSINLNNSRIEFNDEVTFPLNPTSGSITVSKGYRYIDETNGSFLIEADTTKTLEQLVVGDKAEQMGLYLVIKTDLSTDFVLSSTEPTTDISYAEKVVDVYLDRTLSYIYGTTADPRKQLTINATPATASIHMVDSEGEAEVTGTGTASILVPAGHQVTWDVSLAGYTSQSGEETVTEDTTKQITLSPDTSTSLRIVGDDVTITNGIATGFSTTSYLEGDFE